MQVSPLTLLDVFRAVDTVERTVLASGSPFTPNLSNSLKDFLLNLFSPDVLNVISFVGFQRLLKIIVSLSTNILANCQIVLNDVEVPIFAAIADGVRIETFGWMPDEWIAPCSFYPS